MMIISILEYLFFVFCFFFREWTFPDICYDGKEDEALLQKKQRSA